MTGACLVACPFREAEVLPEDDPLTERSTARALAMNDLAAVHVRPTERTGRRSTGIASASPTSPRPAFSLTTRQTFPRSSRASDRSATRHEQHNVFWRTSKRRRRRVRTRSKANCPSTSIRPRRSPRLTESAPADAALRLAQRRAWNSLGPCSARTCASGSRSRRAGNGRPGAGRVFRCGYPRTTSWRRGLTKGHRRVERPGHFPQPGPDFPVNQRDDLTSRPKRGHVPLPAQTASDRLSRQ